MPNFRQLLLYAAAAAAVIAMYATGADAMSLGCEDVWYGPSAGNDIFDCLIDTGRLKDHWPHYIYPLCAVLVFLITLLGVPILICCRCCCACCCTSCCQEPENPKASRCCLWAWIGIALIWAACVLILIIVGADKTMSSFDNIISDLDNPLNYIMDSKDQIYNLLTDWSQDPPVEPDVDLSGFDDVDRQFHENIDSFKDDYEKYFDYVSYASYGLGSICVVLMLLIVPCALCRCAGCLPMVYTVVLWIFGIIFSLVAFALLLVMYLIGAFCGEINLQYAREPGIMQYKVTPWCDEQFNFESARADISQEVVTASQSACSALLEFCDTNEDYSSAAGNTDLIFVCGNGLTNANTCTSLDMVADIVQNTYVKPILSNALCTDTTGWEYQEKCTLATCAERCQNLNNPALQAKDWSMDVVRATNYAINASTALSLVTPMMSCDFIIDTILQAVESQNSGGIDGSANCSNLRTATVMLGTGFFVGSLMCLLGIYILFRGSFVWKADEEEMEADSTPKAKSA